MGEYAMFRGQRIKIGTCEDMLYLRWDQAHLVTPVSGSLNPTDPDVLRVIRFRFPWPDEDGCDPGDFEDHDRGYPLFGFEQPTDIEHGSVQFRANNGYLVSLPCPEGPKAAELIWPAVVHRNGYGGPASLIQQAWRNGRLVGIAQCNGCRYPYRLDDEYASAAVVSLFNRGAHEIARRLTEGYSLSLESQEVAS